MKNKIKQMLLEGFNEDEIVNIISEDERIQEKKRFQFPPRQDKPHYFYDKSSGVKRRREHGKPQEKTGRGYGTYGD